MRFKILLFLFSLVFMANSAYADTEERREKEKETITQRERIARLEKQNQVILDGFNKLQQQNKDFATHIQLLKKEHADQIKYIKSQAVKALRKAEESEQMSHLMYTITFSPQEQRMKLPSEISGIISLEKPLPSLEKNERMISSVDTPVIQQLTEAKNLHFSAEKKWMENPVLYPSLAESRHFMEQKPQFPELSAQHQSQGQEPLYDFAASTLKTSRDPLYDFASSVSSMGIDPAVPEAFTEERMSVGSFPDRDEFEDVSVKTGKEHTLVEPPSHEFVDVKPEAMGVEQVPLLFEDALLRTGVNPVYDFVAQKKEEGREPTYDFSSSKSSTGVNPVEPEFESIKLEPSGVTPPPLLPFENIRQEVIGISPAPLAPFPLSSEEQSYIETLECDNETLRKEIDDLKELNKPSSPVERHHRDDSIDSKEKDLLQQIQILSDQNEILNHKLKDLQLYHKRNLEEEQFLLENEFNNKEKYYSTLISQKDEDIQVSRGLLNDYELEMNDLNDKLMLKDINDKLSRKEKSPSTQHDDFFEENILLSKMYSLQNSIDLKNRKIIELNDQLESFTHHYKNMEKELFKVNAKLLKKDEEIYKLKDDIARTEIVKWQRRCQHTHDKDSDEDDHF